jgi:hypothetical protein
MSRRMLDPGFRWPRPAAGAAGCTPVIANIGNVDLPTVREATVIAFLPCGRCNANHPSIGTDNVTLIASLLAA